MRYHPLRYPEPDAWRTSPISSVAGLGSDERRTARSAFSPGFARGATSAPSKASCEPSATSEGCAAATFASPVPRRNYFIIFATRSTGGLLPLTRLATLVDELEENGGQHLFLFDLTTDGLAALRPATLQQAFPPMPPGPTPAMYADPPDHPQIYFVQRPDALVVKQIHTATFWEKDEERSYSDATERALIVVRRQRRAINLFRVLPDQRRAEIRIDRITHSLGDKDIGEHLRGFLAALDPILNIENPPAFYSDLGRLPRHRQPSPRHLHEHRWSRRPFR